MVTKPLTPHSMDAMCQAGCTSRRGVRFWESEGLLGEVERSPGGVRRFTDDQLHRASIIAAAQFGGWSIADIKTMVDKYDREVFEALLSRLEDQVKAAARLASNLIPPAPAETAEYDL